MPRLEISKKDSITLINVDVVDRSLKEIKQIMAFGIESLIANVGGYIGLFLGFAIIQLPAFCLDVKRQLFPGKNDEIHTHSSSDDTQTQGVVSQIQSNEGRLKAIEEKLDLILTLNKLKA